MKITELKADGPHKPPSHSGEIVPVFNEPLNKE